MQLAEQINSQQTIELRERLENSTATILSLEARVRDANKVDTSIPELLKQVREAAEEELRKYQAESEEQYNRNIAALKAQMDNDAQRLERINAEKTQLVGSIGELKAKITSLEGQIHNLDHQRASLEEMMKQERLISSEQVQTLEKKLHDVQEMLFVKMREANVSRDASIPLKAEIQAMKLLLEEEEKRLQAPFNATCYTSQTGRPVNTTLGTTNISQSYVQPSAPPLSPVPLTTTFVGTARMESPIQTGYTDQYYSQTAAQNEMMEGQFPGNTTKYSYESTAGVNKLQIDPSPPLTPRPIGPVSRVKSAPGTN
ncbi:hypothetical protein KUTeg_023392 [Tegillarca granosa]|uniref:Uncharacterized protein n=1 Tax=Tegillarca granosa TaxID=220873 RepID=A0ABQ9E230_TEGGR|nr:hypothetical protein KUTeg_023392 [Tegillarca granosa]